MYAIILLIASITSTIVWYKYRDGKYSLQTLVLILWASTIMSMVDKAYASIVEGEKFVEATPENMVLGIVLVASAIALWLIHLVYARIRLKF
ncbi:hypothetical protein DKAM_0512 [Desulfurococcus amylolyticus 1221n]|uniref:Uncharacterized protein n=1 Tax=Desulfurococcus amylolyticus (strain DSM 18924 / JCM 16383 / VKM B-2413 / 1221n) TaxID=490899 RepID=B8D407_DESA1|nr:hypothetical protein [Desulfurococcus amylolyticus]ACL10838.1 hypothetical protein DKAM_0512 [Desulfurococcus amylolyticus 1221n]